MLVVTNTSPLHYLVLIEHAAILPALFERAVIPSAVAEELQRPRTPLPVRAWMTSPPTWLEARTPTQPLLATALRLGAGERETLSLAQELRADAALLDDREAREEAGRHGLSVLGTLRVLELAAERQLLDFPAAISRLSETSFYLPSQIVQEMLARDAARKRPM